MNAKRKHPVRKVVRVLPRIKQPQCALEGFQQSCGKSDTENAVLKRTCVATSPSCDLP